MPLVGRWAVILIGCPQLSRASGTGAGVTAHCTRREATDFQAPGSNCPGKPCADLGGDGSGGHPFGSADSQACCQLCADYTGPEVCKYAVFQPGAPKDRNCFLKAGPADAVVGGVGNLGMELLPTSSGWGSTVIVVLLLVSAGYLGGGIVLGMRTSGKTGLAAHPHYHKWVDLQGLVIDGGSAVRSASGRGRAKRRSARDPEGGYQSIAEAEPLQPTPRGRKKSLKKQKATKTSGSKHDNEKHAKGGSVASVAASAPAQPPPPAAPAGGRGSAAGGGGRWVHVS
eukprot:COSAG02_NODE_44_length_45948_cov_81.673493_22_plen_284_part_00